MDSELIAVLQSLAADFRSLRQDVGAIAQVLQQQSLGERPGFSQGSGKRYVYVENDQFGNCWHFYGDRTEEFSIKQNTLTGLVTELRYDTVERGGRTSSKCWVTIAALGQTYVLESGLETVFSRGVVAALAAATQEQLAQPISISVRTGDQESKAVLSTVRDNTGTWIDSRIDNNTPFEGVLAKAMANVAAANGKTVQEMMGDRKSTGKVEYSGPPDVSTHAVDRKVTSEELKALAQAREKHGWSVESFRAYCSRIGFNAATDITRDAFNRLMSDVLPNVELRDTWNAWAAGQVAAS